MEKDLLKRIREIPEIIQLDFERDNKLFIDPYRIDENKGKLLECAKKKIICYFDNFFEAVLEDDLEKVKMQGKNLHEINATKLGYSKKDSNPRGKGFCLNNLIEIFKAAQGVKDIIQDMPDILVFAERVGPDKVSDLTTNIIYEELLMFTHEIIRKYDLPISFNMKKKSCYDVESKKWIKKNLKVPEIGGEEILFLPKEIVSSYQIFSYKSVYTRLVFPYYKAHPSIHGLIRLLKNGERLSDCKKLKERYPCSRETVTDFKEKYPDVYNKYKEEMQNEFWRHR